MGEYEIASLTSESVSVTGEFMTIDATHLSSYLTLLFAYCGATYVTGARLHGLLLSVATVIFFVAAELQALALCAWISATDAVLIAVQEMNPGFERTDNFAFGRTIGIPLWQAGIAAALFFAWRTRQTQAE